MSIERIRVEVFRAPCPRPVATSFGVMRDRPAVFVRLDASDGAFGWGEFFANWPSAGAEHRARLLVEDIAPLILGAPSDDPAQLWADLTRQTHLRALQCGEFGPFAQVIAGVDTALSDLCARRAGLPLHNWCAPQASGSVPVYASGIAASDAQEVVTATRAQGISAFKIKVGFEKVRDLGILRELANDLLPKEHLMADANQAWTLPEALAFAQSAPRLHWLEEPIAADAGKGAWRELARDCPIPLAAGENIMGQTAFNEVLADQLLRVLQPDVAKWGGITGCLAVARKTVAAGLTYCPHFLGGGIGLVASAHLLAAAGGPGLLELDANDNPLRDAFLDADTIRASRFAINNAPGLGVEDLPTSLAPYRTLQLETST